MTLAIRALAHRYSDTILIAGAGITSLLVHLIPFSLFGSHPLGYDTGFYRRYLTQPFVSFPNTPVPGLGEDALVPRVVFDILRLAHFSPDTVLYGSYIALFALTPIVLYLFLKPSLGSRGAGIAAFLVALSPVQYTAYSYMLWKNAWALCLMLLAFACIERRMLVPLLLLDAAIALSHKTTAVIYVASLALLALTVSARRKELLVHALLTAGIFLAVNTSVVTHSIKFAPTAVFISWPEYLGLSIPLFIALIAGIQFFRTLKIPNTVLAFAFVSFSFPLFQLPFYERVFIFADAALVIITAFCVTRLIEHVRLPAMEKSSYVNFGVLCISGGLLLGTLWYQIRGLPPQLSATTIERIEAVGKLVPAEATILTTAQEAPWFQGWTMSHIAAPGMLHDMHNLEEWSAFWSATSTSEMIKFLDDFTPPLYVSTFDSFDNLIGALPTCLSEVTPNLYAYDCAMEK